MKMHNPPHPGLFIVETFLKPYNISARHLANDLNVSPSTLNRILQEKSGISPEMAIRLSIALKLSPEMWMKMQSQYDLWHAEKKIDGSKVHELQLQVV